MTLKQNLVKPQVQMKAYADKSRRPVFHAFLLKRFVSPSANPQQFPPMLSEDMELQVVHVDVNAVCNTTDGVAEVLIQWKDLPEFEAT